jgi:hypothetical protein
MILCSSLLLDVVFKVAKRDMIQMKNVKGTVPGKHARSGIMKFVFKMLALLECPVVSTCWSACF